MAVARHTMTADEFLALPPLDQYRYAQLIDGELVVTSPKAGHQDIVFWLAHQIMSWIDRGPDRGKVTTMAMRCSPHDVFVPDLVWLRPEHWPTPDAGHLEVAPDLVVEVRSPSTWHRDRDHKRRLYEETGVAELWLVDHVGGAVEVWRRSSPAAPAFDERLVLGPGDTLVTSLLPGLTLDLTTLFALDAGR
jgi:Uma2 family endonuclease